MAVTLTTPPPPVVVLFGRDKPGNVVVRNGGGDFVVPRGAGGVEIDGNSFTLSRTAAECALYADDVAINQAGRRTVQAVECALLHRDHGSMRVADCVVRN